MRHVVAQMSVAVTSRTMILALDARGVDPAVAYVIALWVPVLGSALVAELVSSRFIWNRARSLVVDRTVRAERSRREVFP